MNTKERIKRNLFGLSVLFGSIIIFTIFIEVFSIFPIPIAIILGISSLIYLIFFG